MKIIVDAMGGDNAPYEIVSGALAAVEEYGCEVVLVGRGESILQSFEKIGRDVLPAGITISDATETIEMEDDPITAVREKKNSSMVVGLRLLAEGGGDAMVSAGSTGALLTAATLIVKRVPGIRRAALAPTLPNTGNGFVLIDCGANAECTPEYLLQFAFMGAYHAENVLKLKNPRVGLVSNGTESTKGDTLRNETYLLLEQAGQSGALNFIGNIEASGVIKGGCDVAVCDGFTGNVLLKTVEGVASLLFSELKTLLLSGTATKLAALTLKSKMGGLKEKYNADRFGGTALLGISKPVIKAHGGSNAEAIKNAIRAAAEEVNAGTADKLSANIERMKIPEKQV